MLRNTTSKPGGLGDLLADVEHGKLPLTAALAELEGNLQTLRAASPRTAKLPASSKASSIVAKMGAWQLAQKKQGEVSKLPPNRIPTRSSAPQRRTYSPVRDTRQYKGSPTGEITTTAAKTPTTTGDHENLGDTEVWLESTSASPANSGYPRDTYEGAEANRLRARVVAAAVARSRSPNDRSNIATKGRIEFPGREDEEDEDESSKKVLALQQALDKSSKKVEALSQQVDALTQALAGLAARVFNWSEPLPMNMREQLAKAILAYCKPCSGLDPTSLGALCVKLESVRWREALMAEKEHSIRTSQVFNSKHWEEAEDDLEPEEPLPFPDDEVSDSDGSVTPLEELLKKIRSRIKAQAHPPHNPDYQKFLLRHCQKETRDRSLDLEEFIGMCHRTLRLPDDEKWLAQAFHALAGRRAKALPLEVMESFVRGTTSAHLDPPQQQQQQQQQRAFGGQPDSEAAPPQMTAPYFPPWQNQAQQRAGQEGNNNNTSNYYNSSNTYNSSNGFSSPGGCNESGLPAGQNYFAQKDSMDVKDMQQPTQMRRSGSEKVTSQNARFWPDHNDNELAQPAPFNQNWQQQSGPAAPAWRTNNNNNNNNSSNSKSKKRFLRQRVKERGNPRQPRRKNAFEPSWKK
mmetsp:Transcript_72486/g.158180  ORF Transcript_72486/g.158180 Transcript_72486/m.158180 type:complete len:631 (-) Transcript_72486:1952-3844(-)